MTKEQRSEFFVGTAKIDITPKDLTGLTNLWGRPFKGIHDPIFLRALVLTSGDNIAAIVAADLVEFGDTFSLRERIAREIGIPADQILITASHDHNAPRAGAVSPGAIARVGGPETLTYTKVVYDQIVDVIRQAKETLQPAKFGVGTGTADVNMNRDAFTPEGWRIGENPEGPSEKTVWVVKFEDLSGKPIAFLINYAVHSVVIGPKNELVTGDLAGEVARYVEHYHQDQCLALWTMGAAGDQNPKYMREFKESNDHDGQSDYDLLKALGLILGEEVLRVSKQIKRTTSIVRLTAEERAVPLPSWIPLRHRKENAHRPEGHGITVQEVDTVDLRLGLILINQLAITSVSGEVNTKIFQRLKKESPLTNTMMITLANDRLGYIVEDAAYDVPTHETMGTPIQRGFAEDAIINNLVEMINQHL